MFAVNTLISWYRSGADVEARLPALSTWLGHVDPQATYWYLQQSPELLALAAQRAGQSHHDPEARIMSDLAPILQGFFTDRMIAQKHASNTRSAPTGTPGGCCWPSPSTRPAPRHGNWTSGSSTPT